MDTALFKNNNDEKNKIYSIFAARLRADVEP